MEFTGVTGYAAEWHEADRQLAQHRHPRQHPRLPSACAQNGKDVTVSGKIVYNPPKYSMLGSRLLQAGYYAFVPSGQNAHLVQ